MDTIATIDLGHLEGRVKDGVLLFAGVPYAAPPVGDLRFAPPQPHPGWTGTRDATRFANAAPQVAGRGMTDAPPKRMGEDCLTLNITTPALDDARRPVLVWIHGGGFRTGQGAIPWYNGTRFAANGDVVVVSINYRLGALGFTQLDEVHDDLTSSGVSGILDQIAALEWVRDHIAAFGGDPAKVTIAGESAGGMSVGTLLACPAAAGLFRAAIAQSGAGHHAIPVETSRVVARRLRAHLGDDLASLRRASVEQILEAQTQVEKEAAASQSGDFGSAAGMPFQPTVDGRVIPERPIDAVHGGASADVALMVGTNADETTLFFGEMDVDEARLRAIVGRQHGDPDAALAAYRAEHPNASHHELLIALTTDHMFRIPAVRLLEAHTSNGGRGYQYVFTWRSRAFGGRLGATHALEIPFAFDNLDRAGVDAFLGPGPSPQALAEAMHTAWTAFIHTGDPNAEGGEAWPAFDRERRAAMEFGDRVGVLDDPGAATRAVWDGHR